ncbi:mrna-decapping enzyme 1b [Malassezia pachydermatis]|uniref:Mrna-decapping enzyme 1b n=1 Tax=Malassezia pachydermatis TaxID=77020 RepID=A0A0M9VMW0_9BASI|nr:mrna-decapping enzyme 1b [Malassezia pachydermatis]KOS12675.1 mrna-decapping enzyme 1b [Malassezia pachydermatis]
MDLDARFQLNTRVLRRFDPCMTRILGIASFAVLYSFDKEWTKTGTEGPLFLYERSEEPYYCMQILNRDEPENFSVGVTPQDDIELSNEFIIYRSSQKDDAGNEDICGFWIYEPSQLEQLGKLILSLKEGPYPPPPAPTTTSQSIDMDALFSGAPKAAATPPQQVPVFTEEDKTGASILNALFHDAAPSGTWNPAEEAIKPSVHEQEEPSPSAEPAALESENAETTSTIVSEPLEKISETTSTSQPVSQEEVRPASQVEQLPVNKGTSISLDDLFAQTTLSAPITTDAQETTTVPDVSEKLTAPPAPTEEKETSKKNEDVTSAQILGLLAPEETAVRLPVTKSIPTRAEFVQRLVGLLCTDMDYVDQLYARYRALHGA